MTESKRQRNAENLKHGTEMIDAIAGLSDDGSFDVRRMSAYHLRVGEDSGKGFVDLYPTNKKYCYFKRIFGGLPKPKWGEYPDNTPESLLGFINSIFKSKIKLLT